jgi:two-component system response regulator YesN
MYQVLIVDDEKMIRMGMRKAIPWSSLGIGNVFVAKSGEEALDIIREHKPEIMITDISMGEMSGLDLIDLAKKFVPQIRVLVLTGYDKFEYARQCIRLKVHDFFLKPIDEEILIEAVSKQVAFLKKNNIDKLIDINEIRARAVAEQTNIEKFMRDLIHNRMCQQGRKIIDFCEKYHFKTDQKMQVAIIVPALCIDSGSGDDHFTMLSVKNICIGMVDAQNRGLTFMDDYGRIVIAYFLNKQKGSIMEWVQELNGILRDEYNKKPKIAVGNPVDEMMMLYTSYNDAVQLLQHEGEEYTNVIQTEKALKIDHLFRDAFADVNNAMCSSIGDSDKVIDLFDQFCRMTDSFNLSDSYIRKCCLELATSAYYTYLCNSGMEADSRISSFINSIMNVDGEELFELTRQFLIKMQEDKGDQNAHAIIDKSKRYIKEHLSDDLSVSNIAAFLYLSPNYFSRLFKKVTGEGCNEYIIRKRIEKAKLLLETTNLPTGRIAALVGYRDTNYFSLSIKKSTGKSPKKYREEFQKKALNRYRQQ